MGCNLGALAREMRRIFDERERGLTDYERDLTEYERAPTEDKRAPIGFEIPQDESLPYTVTTINGILFIRPKIVFKETALDFVARVKEEEDCHYLIKYWEENKAAKREPPINPKLGRPPTWEDIPIEFKQRLAILSDPYTRIALSLCSKNTKAALDLAPHNYEKMHVRLTPNHHNPIYILGRQDKEDYCIGKANDRQAAIPFINFFRSRNTFVHTLQIGVPSHIKPEPFINEMFHEVEKLNVERGLKLMLNVHTFEWSFFHTSWMNFECHTFIQLVNYLNPEYLKVIRLTCFKLRPKEFERLLLARHWSGLTEFYCEYKLDCKLTEFYHLEKVVIQIKSFTNDEMGRFIANYLTKNLPYPYQFKIRCRRLLHRRFAYRLFRSLKKRTDYVVLEAKRDFFDYYIKIAIPNEPTKILTIYISIRVGRLHGLFSEMDDYWHAHPNSDPELPKDSDYQHELPYMVKPKYEGTLPFLDLN